MALPLRPYHLQRFIHQKLHPNPTGMFKHQCAAHRTRSAVEVQHGSSLLAFNPKPAGADQPLRFSTALPLRPYHPQHFIHQKLHPNPTKMFKHQCEAHRTKSAVEVQRSFSSQAISPAALPPSEASLKTDKHVQASLLRSPPDQISR